MHRLCLIPLLVSCSLGGGLGGEEGYPAHEDDDLGGGWGGDGGGDEDGDGGGDDGDGGDGDVYFLEPEVAQDCDAEDAGPSELSVEVSGSTATVTHAGLVMEDCGTWEAVAEVDTELRGIWVEYDNDEAEDCSSTCGWTLIYSLEDLDAGDWGLRVGADDRVDFTVEE